MRCRVAGWRAVACTAGLALALVASAAHADQALLGLCASTQGARCETAATWTVQETALTPELSNPRGAPAVFQLVVTEGPSTPALSLTEVVTLSGLFESGTRIAAIYLGVQKGDGLGGFTTVASAAVGDTSQPCGCPFVESTLALTARDGSGPALSGPELFSLSYGEARTVALDLRWDLAQHLVQPGDPLRLQPCVVYAPLGGPAATGCFSEGGGTRAVKACSALSFDSCPPAPELLVETLGALDHPIATLGSFTASTSSPSLTPPSLVQQPGGPAIAFTATPSGVAGTRSVVRVEGTVSCGTAEGRATLVDRAVLAGQTAAASIEVSCAEVTPCSQDTQAPVVACPPVTCLALSSCAVASATPTTTATDECGPVVATCTEVLATPEDVGKVLGTVCSATDAAGNVGSVSCPAFIVSAAPAPAPLAAGDYCTYTRHGWGADCANAGAGCVRDARFSSTFAVPLACGAGSGLTLGLDPGARASFDSGAAVKAFLAGSALPSLLLGSPCDPPAGTGGALAGELLPLKLNVRFSDVEALPKPGGVGLGELLLTRGACAGFSARQVLARGEQLLSGGENQGPDCASLDELTAAAAAINGNFNGCAEDLGELRLP